MMNEAVNGGRGKGIVVIKDFPPVTECPVGGHYDRATFIPVRDDLKEEFGPLLIHWQKAQFVNDEQPG